MREVLSAIPCTPQHRTLTAFPPAETITFNGMLRFFHVENVENLSEEETMFLGRLLFMLQASVKALAREADGKADRVAQAVIDALVSLGDPDYSPNISTGPRNSHSSDSVTTLKDSANLPVTQGILDAVTDVQTSSNDTYPDKSSDISSEEPPKTIRFGRNSIINPFWLEKRLAEKIPEELTSISQEEWNHFSKSCKPSTSFSDHCIQVFAFRAANRGVQDALISHNLRGWDWHPTLEEYNRRKMQEAA